MTAILAIENCNLDETTTVSQNAIDLVPNGYTNAGLVAGEEMTIEDLLYALMLASANEAANVLAEYISGSIDDFAVLMNQKATEIGCTNTNFLNANGMHDDNHYTTASDLAKIAGYCMENETFMEIIQTEEYTMPATEQYPETDRVLKNTCGLIDENGKYYYQYALGGKTGYTSQAGNCLVSFAKKDDTYLICVVLNAELSANRFTDAINLFEYGYNNFSDQIIVSEGTVATTIEISNATSETKDVNLVTEEDISDFIENDFDLDDLTYEINLDENIVAPVYLGTKLGEITYTLDNKTYIVNLVAETTAYSAHNYGSYILAIGLILLVVSIIIIPKKKR